MTPHRLPYSRSLTCACVLLLASVSVAAAQFPPVPGQGRPAASFPPPPGPSAQPSPFPPPPGSPAPQSASTPPASNPSICATFPEIRGDVEKAALAIRAAGERKASREEVCPLFKAVVVKEARLVKFLVTNQKTCGVPDQAIKVAKANHAKTIQIRNQVCSGPAGPTGPSLSDALGGPIIADDTATKLPGRGTFDTLTGNVLAR